MNSLELLYDTIMGALLCRSAAYGMPLDTRGAANMDWAPVLHCQCMLDVASSSYEYERDKALLTMLHLFHCARVLMSQEPG